MLTQERIRCEKFCGDAQSSSAEGETVGKENLQHYAQLRKLVQRCLARRNRLTAIPLIVLPHRIFADGTSEIVVLTV